MVEQTKTASDRPYLSFISGEPDKWALSQWSILRAFDMAKRDLSACEISQSFQAS